MGEDLRQPSVPNSDFDIPSSDLEDNAKDLRPADAGRIGLAVSEDTGWQYQPEQTTSAIICHHPQAKYFIA